MSDILIAAAVHGEISNLLSKLKHPLVKTIGGRYMACGELTQIKVRLLITGPGMINMAQALTAAIEHKKPKYVFHIGCAGGFHQAGVNVGDVGIASHEIDAQLGIEPQNPISFLDPLPFPILQNQSAISNIYPLCTKLSGIAFQQIQSAFSDQNTQVFKGPFITVSTITATNQRADKLFKQFSPIMEAMEGSAAAHVCLHYNIPLLEIRAASNLVGKRNRSTWNFETAFDHISKAVSACISHIYRFSEI